MLHTQLISGCGQGTNEGAEARQDPVPVYNPILIEYNGQSNGAGNAQDSSLPAELDGPMSLVQVFNVVTGKWETLEQGVNNRGTTGLSGTGAADTSPSQYGTELRLMYLVKNNYPGTHYLFKLCVSDTDLAAGANTDWASTSVNELTDRSISTFQGFRLGMGDSRPPRVIIWMQGENDANDATKASNYETNLTNLINKKRTAYGYDVPYILVRLSQGGMTMTHRATVNTAMDNVAAALNDVYTINTDDLSTADGVHYAAAEVDTLAIRIFDELELRNLIE